MLQRRGFGKIQKSCQTKKLANFFNEAGQNLVESAQNSKIVLYWEFVLFSMILNRTIPGMVLSETILSEDTM